MQSHAQRQRQQSVLRPRQPKNDVNTGALNDPGQRLAGEAQTPPEPRASAADSLRRCAERDLI